MAVYHASGQARPGQNPQGHQGSAFVSPSWPRPTEGTHSMFAFRVPAAVGSGSRSGPVCLPPGRGGLGGSEPRGH